MTTVKIAGVPEHFNLPWHLCLEEASFKNIGINLEWTDIPEGTGKLCQMLRDGSTDMAVILTEGIIKDIIAGNPSKIVQVYVQSPLIWGIHVGAKSKFQTIEDLQNTRVAISRIGSGSQLMAYVNANNNGWNPNTLQFEIINTINGAVEALTNETADYFMWEHFMTKPLVDKGIFRRLGDCPTPWPSFVIAVRDEFLASNPEIITQVLAVINKKTTSFKSIQDIDQRLATTFNQKIEDIQAWLSLTDWCQSNFKFDEFESIQQQLLDLKIIETKKTFNEIIQE